MKRFSLYIIVAVAAFFALPAVAQQQDQPKAQEKKPVRVITEDDISSTPSTPAKTTDAADTEDKDKKTEAAEEDDDRSDVDKAKEDVKKWTREEESLKNKLSTLQEKEAAEPSEFRKQMYRDAYNNQQTTLGELAAKKAKAEKELAEAQAKEAEEGPKPKKQKKAAEGTADQSKQEEPPQ